jgi:hypothetical protein
MITKIHYQSDQEQLFEACGGLMTNLIEDASQVKSASSDLFSKELIEKHLPDKGHFALHVVGMGAHEFYGPNKNGDAWTKECCERDCDTFVTNGHMFREHNNRHPDLKIGDIKAAAYHPKMNRVELILHGDIKKAEEEFELAKQGKSLSFSMSAKVPWDECSCCGHRAKRASEYCDHLKYHMHQFVPEHNEFAFAFNKKASFFDMSRVEKPADRIAHYLEYRIHPDHMDKAASAKEVIPGWKLAELEGVNLPDDMPLRLRNSSKQQILEKLAGMEAWVQDKIFDNNFLVYISHGVEEGSQVDFMSKVASRAFDGELSDEELSAFRLIEPGTLFRGLAKRATLLPFLSFAAYATGQTIGEAREDESIKKAMCDLPGIFKKLMGAGGISDLEDHFDAGSHFSCGCDMNNDDVVQKFMDDVHDRFGIGTEDVKGRIIRITIKSASATHFPAWIKAKDVAENTIDARGQALAQSYALYKIAALKNMQELNSGFSLDDPQLILAVTPHYLK